MNLTTMLTDELTSIREVEHSFRNYKITDAIRLELDSRGTFCIDTPKGQDIYHMGNEWKNKRKEFMADIKNIQLRF